MEWNVFIGNFNNGNIETYNIFNHWKFKEDCDDAWQKHKYDFPKFSDVIKRSLSYYFWSKCEWETVLSHWPGNGDRFKDKKIDVYEQVMLNWNVFIIYVWNEYYLKSSRKKELKRINLKINKVSKHISNIDLEEEFEDID